MIGVGWQEILVIVILLMLLRVIVRALRRRHKRTEPRTKPQQNGLRELRLADDEAIKRLRERLAAGCPGCKAATGITEDTPLDKVKTAMPKKCFYCGFDFEGLRSGVAPGP